MRAFFGEEALSQCLEHVARRHLKDSYLYYYIAPTSDAVPRAIQQAVNDGVDVINMSISIGGCGDPDVAGTNAVMQAALNAGVVLVSSAGNPGDGSVCNMTYPAHRPETFGMGALDTGDDTVSYGATSMWSGSARGGVPFWVHGSPYSVRYAAGVDAVAPGIFRLQAAPPGNSYVAGSFAGTSNASALMSGLMGHIKNMYWSYNPSWVVDPRVYMAHALVYGDGWGTDSGTQTPTGMSSRSGAGRIRIHRMNSLPGPSGWSWRGANIQQGETLTWDVFDAGPEFPQTTQWKWAVLWTPVSTTDVADVDFYVDDVCGGLGNAFYYDVGYDYRVRFRLGQSVVANRCLRMRAYGFSVPPGGVNIYMVDYFHSGSAAEH